MYVTHAQSVDVNTLRTTWTVRKKVERETFVVNLKLPQKEYEKR